MTFFSYGASAEPRDWSGFYVGGNAGYDFGLLATTDASLTTGGTLFGITPGPSQEWPGEDDEAPFDGPVAGIQAGFNLQNGDVVYGLEADFQLSHVVHDKVIPGAVGAEPRIESNADLQWFSTVRARLGTSVGRYHFYGTGGLAFGQGKGAVTVTASGGTGPAFSASDTEVQVGYALGAGVEAAFTDHWIGRAEILLVDLGTRRYDFAFDTIDQSTATSREKVSATLFRTGLSYRF
jgi:outer membrane immunogenic protein